MTYERMTEDEQDLAAEIRRLDAKLEQLQILFDKVTKRAAHHKTRAEQAERERDEYGQRYRDATDRYVKAEWERNGWKQHAKRMQQRLVEHHNIANLSEQAIQEGFGEPRCPICARTGSHAE